MSEGDVKIPDLVIDYKIAAEGIQLIQGQDTVNGAYLISEFANSAV